MPFWQHINKQISEATGDLFQCQQKQPTGGGCINQTQKISDAGRHYFIKINKRSLAYMFETEALALQEMANTNTVKVPEVIARGEFAQQSFLVLEYLDLAGACNMVQLGEQLAAMHKVTQKQYGWHYNNVIGSTLQINKPMDSWIEFWQKNRLGFQLALAKKNTPCDELQKLGEQLLQRTPVFFENYSPRASMLHGDLWAGNAAGLNEGRPVIFDPAFYYGDREADLAMTELFGGFNQDFYAAYNNVFPLNEGYRVRKIFYNTYHIINHLNLFGGSYEMQAIQMIKRLLSEI